MMEFKLRVKFDDSHLKNPPQLQVVPPMSMENRIQMLRSGFRQVFRAFRLRL